jgi:FMN phosphatase YigB (HAD superfamily)
MSYAAFLDRGVAVSATGDRGSQETRREDAREQVAAPCRARVCPHPQSHDFSTQWGLSYLREWSVALRYIAGVRALRADWSVPLRLGVGTNTHDAPLLHTPLRASGRAPALRVVVTSVEHGRPKPPPSIVAAARARLGCAAETTLFVGDSYDADSGGAPGAGMAAWRIEP